MMAFIILTAHQIPGKYVWDCIRTNDLRHYLHTICVKIISSGFVSMDKDSNKPMPECTLHSLKQSFDLFHIILNLQSHNLRIMLSLSDISMPQHFTHRFDRYSVG
jgi:hypothetical protein